MIYIYISYYIVRPVRVRVAGRVCVCVCVVTCPACACAGNGCGCGSRVGVHVFHHLVQMSVIIMVKTEHKWSLRVTCYLCALIH